MQYQGRRPFRRAVADGETGPHRVSSPGCCSASSFDLSESREIEVLPPCSASNLRAERQPFWCAVKGCQPLVSASTPYRIRSAKNGVECVPEGGYRPVGDGVEDATQQVAGTGTTDSSVVYLIEVAQDRGAREVTQADRPRDRVRLLLCSCVHGPRRNRLRNDYGQLQSGDRIDRLRHRRPPLFRAAHARGCHRGSAEGAGMRRAGRRGGPVRRLDAPVSRQGDRGSWDPRSRNVAGLDRSLRGP